MTNGSQYAPYQGRPTRITRMAAPGETDRRATVGIEVVYYIRLDSGLIKIGTSSDMLARLQKHGLAACRRGDQVLAIEFGGAQLERERHAEFKHLRESKAERFRPGPDLLAHIERLRKSLGIAS